MTTNATTIEATDRKAAADQTIDDAANAGCSCQHLNATHIRDGAGVWHVVLDHEDECEGLRRP